MVFSSFFRKQICAQNFEVLLSGPSWPFLCCNKLGPGNNTHMAQIITPQYVLFAFSCFKKCAEIPIFTMFFTTTKVWQKMAQKTITFHILQNTGY